MPNRIIKMNLRKVKEKPRYLDAFPGVSNGDGTMLLDDIEQGSGDRLPLLRRRFNCHRPHLWLRLLRQTSNCRPKHCLPQSQTLFCKSKHKIFMNQSTNLPMITSLYNSVSMNMRSQHSKISKLYNATKSRFRTIQCKARCCRRPLREKKERQCNQFRVN